MENIQRVTAHLGQKVSRPARCQPPRAHVDSGARRPPYHRDTEGNYWRAYVFIEGARTFDAVESTQQAFQAAKAFGQFQKLLADLPAPRLHDTIPDFHHTPKRFAALEKAIEADAANRAHLAKPEIEFALRHKAATSVLLERRSAGARHAQRHQVQQRHARRRDGRGNLRD